MDLAKPGYRKSCSVDRGRSPRKLSTSLQTTESAKNIILDNMTSLLYIHGMRVSEELHHLGRSSMDVWHPWVVFPSVACMWLLARLLPGALPTGSPWRLLVALLIVPAMVYLLATHRRWFQKLDELQQRVLLETLVAALATILVAVWGLHFMQKAGFLVRVEYLDAVGLAYIVGFFGGYFFASRKYGGRRTPPL